MRDKFSITNTTKKSTPLRVPFLNIKNSALGKDYSLSLVFIGEEKSRKLNFSYREKNKPTNVLSFPLDKKNGEIFICLPVVKKETKKFGRNFANLVTFLFIHGLMHLKGFEHGSKMEKAELKLRKQFRI